MRFTRPGHESTRPVFRNDSADVRLIGLADIKASHPRRRLLISFGRRAKKVLASFSDSERATEFIGFLDDSPDFADKATLLGVLRMGNVEALTSVLDSHIVDQVIVALPPTRFHLICRIVGICYARGIRIFVPADVNSLLKTVEDKLIAALSLVLLSPLFIILAVLIKIDSPGPVLFCQVRYGYRNALINVYKFRTMYAHQGDPEGTRLTERADKRITRIGRLLRRTSLDELPQLLNVLRGDMSVVGPRPHARAASAAGIPYEQTMEDYALRHRVKPGITGWAQVNGLRGDTETLEKIWSRVAHDLYYIENWSLLLDIEILLRTAWQLIRPPNTAF
jgi:lipopolysaccharide/colanic/teichoic acid biosynthesis glycosyltransferase